MDEFWRERVVKPRAASLQGFGGCTGVVFFECHRLEPRVGHCTSDCRGYLRHRQEKCGSAKAGCGQVSRPLMAVSPIALEAFLVQAVMGAMILIAVYASLACATSIFHSQIQKDQPRHPSAGQKRRAEDVPRDGKWSACRVTRSTRSPVLIPFRKRGGQTLPYISHLESSTYKRFADSFGKNGVFRPGGTRFHSKTAPQPQNPLINQSADSFLRIVRKVAPWGWPAAAHGACRQRAHQALLSAALSHCWSFCSFLVRLLTNLAVSACAQRLDSTLARMPWANWLRRYLSG